MKHHTVHQTVSNEGGNRSASGGINRTADSSRIQQVLELTIGLLQRAHQSCKQEGEKVTSKTNPAGSCRQVCCQCSHASLESAITTQSASRFIEFKSLQKGFCAWERYYGWCHMPHGLVSHAEAICFAISFCKISNTC